MLETALRFLVALTSEQVVVGLAITAAVVAVAVDWRLVLLALAVQYFLTSVLLNDYVLVQIAVTKVLVGGFCLLVLYRTGRRVQEAVDALTLPGSWVDREHEALPISAWFRVLALGMWTLGIVAFNARVQFNFLDHRLLSAAYWLGGFGVLAIMLTRNPLKTTAALLTFQNGFEVLFTALEPGLLLLGFLGTANILTALVGAYLTVVRNLPYLEPLQNVQSWDVLSLEPAEPARQEEETR